jgi:Ca2+-binding RTX toxin-like protein
MHKAFLVIPSVLAATLIPSLSNAEEAAYTCLGYEATIVGTAGADALVGTDGPDVIVGLRGRDGIAGGGGNDLICGGLGADDGPQWESKLDGLSGGEGADVILGGWGDDQLHGGGDKDRLLGGVGGDALCDAECYFDLDGGSSYMEGADYMFVSKDQGADDRMFGGPGADQFLAASGDEIMGGGGGDDRMGGRWLDLSECDRGGCYLKADEGNDTYLGGPGNDQLYDSDNWSGNDFFDGGTGIDGCGGRDPSVNCP